MGKGRSIAAERAILIISLHRIKAGSRGLEHRVSEKSVIVPLEEWNLKLVIIATGESKQRTGRRSCSGHTKRRDHRGLRKCHLRSCCVTR